MLIIPFVGFELVEDVDEGSLWISFDAVFNPSDFFFGVALWMGSFLVCETDLSAILSCHIKSLLVGFHRVVTCFECM